MAERVELPRRPDTGQALGPHHVEVGLAACRHLGRFVGAELPDRVDLQQAPHQAEDAGGHREERAGLDREDRHDPHADDVLLGATRAGELGVLLEPHQRKVNPDERQDDSRDQQDVQRVHAGQQVTVRGALVSEPAAREVATEQRPVQPGADHRDCHCDRGQRGAQADAGQQVVGQRVAEVALEHRQDQQQRTDHPIGFTWPPEGAGEEDAGQVHHDRRGEHQRRPVVDLPDEQPAAHLEADVQGGREGLGHLDTAQRLIHAVVGDLGHRRVEEQRQVYAGEQQDDERIQSNLAQQERPVGREHLVQLAAHRRRRVIPRIDRIALCCCDFSQIRFWQCWTHERRSQNAGPTGSMKSPLATRYPS